MNVSDEIERIYKAFSVKKKPDPIGACPCCHDQNGICSLLKTPLRQLTSAQLSDYAASVFLTAGGEKDFRYLLPRILELSFRERHWGPGIEVVLGKLTLANWMDWDSTEIDMIQSFFNAAFDEVIRTNRDSFFDVDSWICGLALAGTDVSPYLRKLEDPVLKSALFGFFELNSAALLKGKLANSFWNGNETLAAPVIEWFESPAIRSAVWKHYGLA